MQDLSLQETDLKPVSTLNSSKDFVFPLFPVPFTNLSPAKRDWDIVIYLKYVGYADSIFFSLLIVTG